MKLTQCENGHFYDAERYASCPHCSGGPGAGGYHGNEEDSPTEALYRNNTPGADTDTTVPLGGFGGGQPAGGFGSDVTVPLDKLYGGEPEKKDEDDDKTIAMMGWWNDTQAEAAPKPKTNQKPIVGWLVCIEGSNYGRAFDIYGGQNFIGRSDSMDISIKGDPTISREKHAIIIYEPRQREFYVQQGESHELCYVNDNVVIGSQVLNDRDVIMLGKTSLVFVPFCDEHYGWEK